MSKDDKSIKQMNTIFRVLVLSLLKESSRSGYDIIKSIEKLTGVKPSEGKVYPFLHDLLNSGQIEECAVKKGSHRQKINYKLTANGEDSFKILLQHLEHFFNNYLTECFQCGCKAYKNKAK
jgi:DNA-binding PadR family transcriptional regulator